MKLLFGSKDRKVLSIIFCISILYWILFIGISHYKAHPLGLYTQIPLIIIPIFGGLVGFYKSRQWGGWRSVMGKAILGLSLGMVVWGFALGMWTYYTVLGTAVPYPSLADFVFIWSPILWMYGLLELFRVIGARFSFRNLKESFVGFGITSFVGIVAYLFLVVIAHGNAIGTAKESIEQLFFDYAYTVEMIAIVTLVGALFVLSRKYLGGKYKRTILLLFLGFFVHFIAIFFFVKTTGDNTYFNGNIADILFTVAVYFESLGIINLDIKLFE